MHERELPVLKPPPSTITPPSRVPKPTGTICPAAPVGSMKIVGPLTLLKFLVAGPGAPGAVWVTVMVYGPFAAPESTVN